MKHSYMDYAMSVIIGRALPDIRDGLKPAHRRVLFAMRQLGLVSNRAYRKCATVVGDVIGKYHPHGDAPVYDTLVRLAQDFNMRYMLVDGQGNFGSVDGDPPAAMRYTECRPESLADAMMADLPMETVDFVPNYDETMEEPVVLPAPFPNLLVNGSSGIAVGMATNIPPHNLREVIDAVIWTIEAAQSDQPLTAAEKQRKLLEIVPGPDFPTGGYIVGRQGIQQAYLTGRGSILMRAKAEIEVTKKGDRQSIIISAIPYQVNKARLIERMAELVREKTIEGISDLRDESDRDGLRIAVELKRGEVGEVVLNNLYKHTQLQTTFGVIMLAIVAGRPKILTLVEFIDNFIEFRRQVVRRRLQFELRKAEARAHILEGLKIALDHLDAVITLIRQSKNPVEARTGLMTQFGLSQIQSQAILDMQLQRLTGLERQKILDELAEVLALIERLRAILASDKLLMEIIVAELRQVRDKYGDDRRTEILAEEGDFRIEDLIAEEEVAITVTGTGYIKRTAVTTYRNQRRGGKGRIGMRTREEDYVSHLFVASTHAYIMIFSDRGRAYWLKVHEVPDVGPDGRGKAIANLVSMEDGERIAALITVKEFEDDKFVVMGTRKGVVKKTELSAFSNPRAGGIIAMGVEEGDAVIAAEVSDGTHEVFIGTRDGMAIRFPETDVRPMGRTAYGVRGISLREDDAVVAMEILSPGRHHRLGDRAGLRQAHRPRGVSPAVARRRRHHQHPDQRAQRHGGRRGTGHRRRRADADHAAGQDPAHGLARHPHDRPRHAGRPPDRHRGRGPRRVDCQAGRARRRGSRHGGDRRRWRPRTAGPHPNPFSRPGLEPGAWSPASSGRGWLELGVFRSERFGAHSRKPDDELRVVVERLHRHDGARAELRVLDAQAHSESQRRRLILVLVGVAGRRRGCRRLAAKPARTVVAVARRPRPVSRWHRERSRRHLVHQLGGDLVDEPRRLGGLVVAEDAAPGRRRQHDLFLRAGQADVAEPALLLQLGVVVHRTGMGKEAFFQAADDDGRELEALGAVQRHHQHQRVLRAGLLVGVRQQRQLIDETGERRLGRARLVLARGRHQLGQVFDPALGFLAVLVAQVLQVARPVQHLADTDGHGVLACDLRQLQHQGSGTRPAPYRPWAPPAARPRPVPASTRVTAAPIPAGPQTAGWPGSRTPPAAPPRAHPSRPCRCREPAR